MATTEMGNVWTKPICCFPPAVPAPDGVYMVDLPPKDVDWCCGVLLFVIVAVSHQLLTKAQLTFLVFRATESSPGLVWPDCHNGPLRCCKWYKMNELKCLYAFEINCQRNLCRPISSLTQADRPAQTLVVAHWTERFGRCCHKWLVQTWPSGSRSAAVEWKRQDWFPVRVRRNNGLPCAALQTGRRLFRWMWDRQPRHRELFPGDHPRINRCHQVICTRWPISGRPFRGKLTWRQLSYLRNGFHGILTIGP